MPDSLRTLPFDNRLTMCPACGAQVSLVAVGGEREGGGEVFLKRKFLLSSRTWWGYGVFERILQTLIVKILRNRKPYTISKFINAPCNCVKIMFRFHYCPLWPKNSCFGYRYVWGECIKLSQLYTWGTCVPRETIYLLLHLNYVFPLKSSIFGRRFMLRQICVFRWAGQ